MSVDAKTPQNLAMFSMESLCPDITNLVRAIINIGRKPLPHKELRQRQRPGLALSTYSTMTYENLQETPLT